ncbi:hypothetical protein B0H13DRAFT_2370351 [Mycena leptocephala]|nr:hypothetical protein B0H13DRAFT_2370351 [Mycena leptocephala]
MDIDSGPNGSESKLGPTGLCEAGTNHSLNYFYKDGSVYITPNDSSVIYCVWGSRLSKFSEFFNNLLSLANPNPTISPAGGSGADCEMEKKPVETARKKAEESGGDGKSEGSPLWIQPTEATFEVFLECVFSEVGQDVLKTRPVAFWVIALEMADFFGAPLVTQSAKRGLSACNDFDPILRLQLAIRYAIAEWINPAFRRLIHTPLSSLSSAQIEQLGFHVYVILAKTQSKITTHRILCALTVPPVEHGQTCDDHTACNKSWAHAWWGESIKHGVAVALIHPNHVPAQKILHQLPSIITSWHMLEECRSQTVRSLAVSPSRLLQEEGIIMAAIEELKKLR